MYAHTFKTLAMWDNLEFLSFWKRRYIPAEIHLRLPAWYTDKHTVHKVHTLTHAHPHSPTQTHRLQQTGSHMQAKMRRSQVRCTCSTSLQRPVSLSLQVQLHTLTLVHTNESTHGKVADTLLVFESVPELQKGGAVMQRDRFRSLTHCWDEYRRREDAACWRERRTCGMRRRTIRRRDRGGKKAGTSQVLQEDKKTMVRF